MTGEHSHHGSDIQVKGENHLENKAAPGISYFTPQQDPPAGTALAMKDGSSKIPKLFTPLKLRGLTLQNRIGVCIPSKFTIAHTNPSSSPLSANTPPKTATRRTGTSPTWAASSSVAQASPSSKPPPSSRKAASRPRTADCGRTRRSSRSAASSSSPTARTSTLASSSGTRAARPAPSPPG